MTWLFRCECGHAWHWRTHPHTPGEPTGGPPRGCPACGSSYYLPERGGPDEPNYQPPGADRKKRKS